MGSTLIPREILGPSARLTIRPQFTNDDYGAAEETGAVHRLCAYSTGSNAPIILGAHYTYTLAVELFL